MGNGLGVTLPLLLGGGSMLGGLFNQRRAMDVIRRAIKPGGLPGTMPTDMDILPGDTSFNRMVNEVGRLDPRMTALKTQWDENERARDVQRGYFDDVVEDAQGSRLFDLADTVGGWRGSLDDFASGKTGAEGADPFSQRMKSHQAKGADLTGRIKALNDEVSGNFRRTIADPTVMNDRDMDAIVGKYIGDNNAWAAGRAAENEQSAGARGLSRSAAAALQAGTAADARRMNQDKIAALATLNASESAKRGDAANEALATAGGNLLGLEGSVGSMFEGLDDNIVGLLPGLVAQEGNLAGTAEDRVSQALYNRAGLEQPENYAIAGDVASEVGRYNTLLEAGQYDAIANMLSNMGGGLLQFGSSSLDRKAQSQAAGGGGLFDSLVGPLAGGAGLGVGAAAMTPITGGLSTIGTKIFSGLCLAGDTPIETLRAALTPLADVRIGDRVRTPAGWREVIGRDCGAPHPQNDVFLEVTTDNHVLVVTPGHRLDGRPAGELQPGDKLAGPLKPSIVLRVRPAQRRPATAGDLKLAGGAKVYAAAGVWVESMYA
jgi:hypothetical protein